MRKYKVTVRPLQEEDATGDCRFPETDAGTYAVHLGALIDDLRNIPGVVDACLSGNEIFIESNLEQPALKQVMKGLFSREACNLRYLGIEMV